MIVAQNRWDRQKVAKKRSVIRVRVAELLETKFKDNPQDKPSQRDLAEILDMRVMTVNYWLNNRVERPDLETLAKWCDYLGVGVEDILVREDEQ